MVTSVSAVSLLVRSPPPDVNNLPFGRAYGLIFLNLAADENILSEEEGSANDLFGVLADVYSLLAETGTLVIALPDCVSRVDRLKRESYTTRHNVRKLMRVFLLVSYLGFFICAQRLLSCF